MNSILTVPSNSEPAMGADRTIVPAKFAHVVLHSTRFAEMVRWYKTVLGAHATMETQQVAFLTYDDEHHRVAIVGMAGAKRPEPGAAGVHHFAFTYASLSELLLTHERLASSGIRPYWAVNHGPTTSLYYHDPDGNRVELQVDNFDTAEEGVAYCARREFMENPVGVDIDPVDLLRRVRAGESERQLKVRPNIGPRDLMDFPNG
jgi:catechol 2,3-dioxygenase-like lactoylglutathione lyase family enzyme